MQFAVQFQQPFCCATFQPSLMLLVLKTEETRTQVVRGAKSAKIRHEHIGDKQTYKIYRIYLQVYVYVYGHKTRWHLNMKETL